MKGYGTEFVPPLGPVADHDVVRLKFAWIDFSHLSLYVPDHAEVHPLHVEAYSSRVLDNFILMTMPLTRYIFRFNKHILHT